MTRTAAVAAALATTLQACAHAHDVPPPARVRSYPYRTSDLRVFLAAIEVRAATDPFSTGPSSAERKAALADASRRAAASAARATARGVDDRCQQVFLQQDWVMTQVLCGLAFLAVPISAAIGAATGRRDAAAWLPADVPELDRVVRPALAEWAASTAPAAVLAQNVVAAGEGSGYELRAIPAASAGAPPRTDAAITVAVEGGGLEWADDGARLALFVEVAARLRSPAISSRMSVHVRDAESYPRARWAADPRATIEARMPALLRRTAGVIVHGLLLSVDGPERPSAYGDAVCGLGPMTADGALPALSTAPEVSRGTDGSVALAWEPWWGRPGTGPVSYDLRIFAEDSEEPVVSADGLRTNSVPVGTLDPSRTYRFTVRAVAPVGSKRLVSRWWRRAEGTPCSPLDAVAPPRDSLFTFRTPPAPHGAGGVR